MTRVALVTGGGRGIGAAVARRLAADGFEVAVSGRTETTLAAVAEEIGGHAIVADSSVPAEAERAVAETVDRFGGLDVLVPNAGISHGGTVLEQTPESWERVIGTNLTGVFLICRAALPHLIERRGSIVAISSVGGLTAGYRSSVYCTSKAGVNMLIQSIAYDFGPEGVRANAVCPAWTRTDMGDGGMDDLAELYDTDREGAYRIATATNPLRRAATPEEVADAVAWLCTPGAAYVNGVLLPIDGGGEVVNLGMLPFERRP